MNSGVSRINSLKIESIPKMVVLSSMYDVIVKNRKNPTPYNSKTV